MINVLSKLATARLFIKSQKLNKDGKNTFSNYDYFTPALVSSLVNKACTEANLICLFSLKKDDHGYYGEVTLTDLETGENLVTIMRTEKPTIKATNETQQMGGMNTYTKRYALMSLFDIEDNSIDFDSQDNTKKPDQKQQKEIAGEKPWLNESDEVFTKAIEKLKAGGTTVEKIAQSYRLSKAVREKLQSFQTAN